MRQVGRQPVFNWSQIYNQLMFQLLKHCKIKHSLWVFCYLKFMGNMKDFQEKKKNKTPSPTLHDLVAIIKFSLCKIVV